MSLDCGGSTVLTIVQYVVFLKLSQTPVMHIFINVFED